MPLVTISTYVFPHELALDRAKLESDGIVCFVQDELTVQVHNFLSNAVGGIKLQVLEQDVNRAKAILADSNNLIEDYPESKIKCSKCRSGNVTGKGLNGKISMVILMITGLPIPIFSSKYHCFDCGIDFKLNEEEID